MKKAYHPRYLLGLLLIILCATISQQATAAPDFPDQATLAAIQAQLPNPAQPGPYHVGRSYVTVSRPDNTSFSAYLYYPSLSDGTDTPFDSSGAPYPGITLGHGYIASPLNYDGNSRHLASWGYFVIAIGSYTGFLPDVLKYTADYSHSLTYLTLANDDPNSPFYQAVNTNAYGATGHSMGGGASILATANDPRIKALINMAAAETAPISAIDQMANITVPVALLAASNDIVTPVPTNQQPMYDNSNAPRLLPILQGADHCAFASEGSDCGGGGDMSDARQVEITNRWLAAFFNLYLRGEISNAWYVWGPGMTLDREVITQSDAGFSAAPFYQTQTSQPGNHIIYTITVNNHGPYATSFSLHPLLHEWPVTVTPAQLPELTPGQSATITVEVSIPGSVSATQDILLLAVIADKDGATGQYSIMKTAVP